MFITRQGIQYKYNGPRTAQGIVDWVRLREGLFSQHMTCPQLKASQAASQATSLVLFEAASTVEVEDKVFKQVS